MVMTKLEDILKILEICKTDATKVDGGNRSAATRLRKDASSVVRLIKELRNLALETVKTAKDSKK